MPSAYQTGFLRDTSNGALVITGGLPAITSIEAAGHSWPAGTFLASPTGKYNFVTRLGKTLGATVTNLAQSGAIAGGPAADGGPAKLLQAAGLATDLTGGPYVTPGGLKVLMLGDNDHTGTPYAAQGAAGRAVVEQGLLACVAALQAGRRIPPADAAFAYSAGMTFFADTTISQGTGYRYCTANGETVTLTLDAGYSGEAIFFPIPVIPNVSGTWTFRLNPAGANSLIGTHSSFGLDGAVFAVGKTATCGYLIPKGTIPAGAQVIRATSSGLTGSNYCTMSGALILGEAPVLMLKTPNRSGDHQYDTAYAWVNARRQAVVDQLPASVFPVDLQSYLSPNSGLGSTAEALDTPNYNAAPDTHPNLKGHGKVAAGCLAAIATNLTASHVGAMS